MNENQINVALAVIGTTGAYLVWEGIFLRSRGEEKRSKSNKFLTIGGVMTVIAIFHFTILKWMTHV